MCLVIVSTAVSKAPWSLVATGPLECLVHVSSTLVLGSPWSLEAIGPWQPLVSGIHWSLVAPCPLEFLGYKDQQN